MGSSPCCSKDSDLNRGSWTAKEDMILSEYVTIHGEGRWRSLPKKAGLKRCGKSCRLRWLNYLRPDIKRGNISQDEEELIIRLHRLLGNRWSLIAGRLPGRTDNEVKNYWNTKLSKRLADNEILTKSPTRQALVKSPPKAGDSVLKITPVKATAVRTAKSFSNKNSGGGYKSYHQDLWSRDDAETVKASKSWCGLLVDDFITHKNSDFVDFPIMQKFASSGSPSMDIDAHSPTSVSNFVDRKPRRSQHSAPNEVNMSNGLIYLNDLRSPECELLLSPCNSPEDFEARSTTELEQMSCIDSNLQQLGSFSVGGEQAMVELEQHGDWVGELETLQKSSLGLLMLESEENWVERCYNLSL